MKKVDHIFLAYDIRGLAPEEIDQEFAEQIGKVFASHIGAKRLVVGRDMRQTTPMLVEALISGIRSLEVGVVDVGLVTTPMFYFAVAEDKAADGGIMVTASHNPAKYNGFKFTVRGAKPFGGSELQELRKKMDIKLDLAKKPGDLEYISVADEYVKKLMSVVKTESLKDFRVVIDAGNGMAGVILPKLSEKIGLKSIPLYWELDGTFPNHIANPIESKNLADLRKKVIEEQAPLGLAFDGDGDRIGFVDEKGEIIPADIMAALIAPLVLEHRDNKVIVCDVRCSRVVQEEVERLGGRIVKTPVGHSLVKKVFQKEGAVFGAELAGHFFFADFYGADCTDLAALYLMRLMADSKKPLSELVAPLKRYAASGEINFRVDDKKRVLEGLTEQYKDGETTSLDGVRVDFEDWWFLVRGSNTVSTPVLRLIVEAKNRELMEEKCEELISFIEKAGGVLDKERTFS